MEKDFTIGVAGHADHGKSALVRSLTGIDTDRLQEEKRRGLSIQSGIAPLELSSGKEIAIIDVPGHTDFLKNTIRGLSCIDMAILVVAADDGIMPQTLEHLGILSFLKAKTGFIVLSKADLVDDETLELAELEIEDAISGTFLEGKPILPFSAIDSRGLDEILLIIEEEGKKIAGKDLRSPFRLWIDQVRTFPGFGTVVSGTVLSGTIRQGDLIHLLPSVKETRTRFLEVHHRKVSLAVAGQRVGINLRKVSREEAKTGMALSKPGLVKPTNLLNVDLHVLKRANKPIRNRQKVKLYLGTSVTNALVVIMEKEQLWPGENSLVQFQLLKHVPALPGDPFVVCLLNIQSVIGGGTVLEISLEKYRAVKAANTIPYLKALQDKNLKVVMDLFFNRNISRPVTSLTISHDTGFQIDEVEAEIRSGLEHGELLYFEGRGFFGKNYYQRLKKRLPEIVKKILSEEPLKLTVSAEEIRNRLPRYFDEAPFQRMLEELCRAGKLIQAGGGFNIPNLSVPLSPEQERLAGLLLDYAQKSGFVPFNADTFWKLHKKKLNKNEIQRLLDYLHARKRLICLNNRRFLTPHAMERIKKKVRELIKKNGKLTIGDCKAIMGYGRTVGIPVLDYLDSIGFTVRQGDKRVLKEVNQIC